jgi:hypothetical protein
LDFNASSESIGEISVHDYEPSWDYPVVDQASDLESITPAHWAGIEAAIARAQRELLPAMGMEHGFEVFYVEPLGLTSFAPAPGRKETGVVIAVYCNGTALRPVVGFDLESMLQVCDEEGLDLVHQFTISLAHELAHAYQDSLGMGIEDEHEFDEDDAESFAIAWADEGRIDLDALRARGLDEAKVSLAL